MEDYSYEIEKKLIYCVSFESTQSFVESSDGYILLLESLRFSENFNDQIKDYNHVFERSSFFKFSNQILIDLSQLCNQLDFENARQINSVHIVEDTSLNERRIFILLHVIRFVNILIPVFIGFRNFLIENNGLKSLLYLLSQHEFVEKLQIYDVYFLNNLIFDINWLSKTADTVKNVWEELSAVEILTSYLRKFTPTKLYILMALSNIASDKELENIDEFTMTIDILTEMTDRCVNNYDSLKTQEFLNEYDNSVYYTSVRSIYDWENNANISLPGILLTLYKISINAKRKNEIYRKPNLKANLYKCFYEGNDAERVHALELITQFCFDKTIFEEIKKDTEFHQFVENLSKSQDITFKKLYKTCENFLFHFKHVDKASKECEKETEHVDKHIMISYNSASRDLCLKIKSYLESLNYKVWIDVEEIHGSSLDSMAKAVEEAELVLICVTEKYRQSLNCQSEAQYAFRLNKPIIPCIMQEKYGSVGGWLGFIIGDKIFIDFTKYQLNDAFKRLSDQIVRLRKNSKKVEPIPFIEPPVMKNLITAEPPRDDQVESWDESKVEKWLLEHSLDEFSEILRPINGENLHQLYQLQVHTPEFFYKSLTKYDNIDIKKLLIFITLLKKLFTTSN